MSSSSEGDTLPDGLNPGGRWGRFSPRLAHVTHFADRILIPL